MTRDEYDHLRESADDEPTTGRALRAAWKAAQERRDARRRNPPPPKVGRRYYQAHWPGRRRARIEAGATAVLFILFILAIVILVPILGADAP